MLQLLDWKASRQVSHQVDMRFGSCCTSAGASMVLVHTLHETGGHVAQTARCPLEPSPSLLSIAEMLTAASMSTRGT